MSRILSMKVQPDWTTEVYQVPAGKRAVITAAISNNNANAKINLSVQKNPLPTNFSATKKISSDVTKSVFPTNLGFSDPSIILFKNSGFGMASSVSADRLTTLGPYNWPDVGYWNFCRSYGIPYGVSRSAASADVLTGYVPTSNDYRNVTNGRNYDGSVVQIALTGNYGSLAGGCGAYNNAINMSQSGAYYAIDSSISDSWTNTQSLTGNKDTYFANNWDGQARAPYNNIGAQSRRVCPNSVRFDYVNWYWLVLSFPSGATNGRARIGVNRTETLYSPNWYFTGDISPEDHQLPQWLRVYSTGWTYFTADKKAFCITPGSVPSTATKLAGDHSLLDPAYPWIEYSGSFYAVGTNGLIYSAPVSSTSLTWTVATTNVAGAPANALWSKSNGGTYPALDISYQLADGVYTTLENEVNVDPAAWLEYQITMRNMRVPLLLSEGDRLFLKSTGSDTAIHIMGYEENV